MKKSIRIILICILIVNTVITSDIESDSMKINVLLNNYINAVRDNDPYSKYLYIPCGRLSGAITDDNNYFINSNKITIKKIALLSDSDAAVFIKKGLELMNSGFSYNEINLIEKGDYEAIVEVEGSESNIDLIFIVRLDNSDNWRILSWQRQDREYGYNLQYYVNLKTQQTMEFNYSYNILLKVNAYRVIGLLEVDPRNWTVA